MDVNQILCYVQRQRALLCRSMTSFESLSCGTISNVEARKSTISIDKLVDYCNEMDLEIIVRKKQTVDAN